MPYEILEHTADYKIKVKGKNLEELFRSALEGMMDFLYQKPKSKQRPQRYDQIKLNADKAQNLLVDFLSELLYLSDSNNLCYQVAKFQTLTETEVQAEVSGFKTKAKDDIKAVTYHDLKITKTTIGYEAIILFDI